MTTLLSLPLELREEIWSLVCQSYAPFDLLRTNRQVCSELPPFLYKNVIVHLLYPRQILRWVHKIGNYNSSCIRYLTIKFPALVPDARTFQYGTTEDIWAASLDAMYGLDTLIYYFDPSKHYTEQCLGLDEDHPCRFTTYEKAMEKTGARYPITSPRNDGCGLDILESLSTAHSRPITHAMLAIDEPIPEINMVTFMKLFSMKRSTSLQQNIHGLPPELFNKFGLELVRTYTMIEDPNQQSLALTYRRHQSSYLAQPPNLRSIFSNLPRLKYLRLGCPNVDSAFLTELPPAVQTVDISFRDPSPERIARNLKHMRQRCQDLFTLAIAVSPLHDLVAMPDGGRQIDQLSRGEVGLSDWEPFWDALKHIQATGVKVWEGEGPGSSRARNGLAMLGHGR